MPSAESGDCCGRMSAHSNDMVAEGDALPCCLWVIARRARLSGSGNEAVRHAQPVTGMVLRCQATVA